MLRRALPFVIALAAAGCGGGDGGGNETQPASTPCDERALARSLHRQAHDQHATAADRQRARLALRALKDDEFQSGCTEITIP